MGNDGSKAARGAGDASWAELRRPLRVEPLATTARCPVTTARVLSPRFARGQGSGPVYPVGAARGLKFIYPVEPTQGWYPSEWSGNKVAWVARKGFSGRVLIRGWRRDGSSGVRFGDRPQPQTELRLTFSAKDLGEGGWLNKGTFTRVRAPGCYAWQLDGLDFTRVITFRAIRVP
jgi:hypothetical protein